MSVALALTIVGLALGFVVLAHVRSPQGTGTTASVSVIIPVRNEEESLPHLLRSLADQTLAPVEILVVNDGSTDGTARVASEAGATVIQAPPLPEGWVGKSWACHLGSLRARGKVLAFLDADVVVAADGLERVVASWAREVPSGLLSVQPFHVTHKAYEQFSAYPNLVSVMGPGPFAPSWVPQQPIAFGPCLVTSAAAYRRVGGHESVAGEVIEDIHLARTFGAAGLPVRALAGGSALSFRMYPGGMRQLIDGWTKNLAGGPGLVAAVPLLATVAWVLASAGVAADAVEALVTLATTGQVAWAAVAGWALVTAQTGLFLRRIGSFRWWAAAAFPILLAGFVALFVRSAIYRSVRRSVTWHGRSVAVSVK